MLKDFNNLLEEAKKLEPVIVSVAVAEERSIKGCEISNRFKHYKANSCRRQG